MKQRGFEIVSSKAEDGLHLPMRQTAQAAGYDFEASQDFELPSVWQIGLVRIFKLIHQSQKLSAEDYEKAQSALKPYLVPSGIKAYMQPNEYLLLANRSSNPLKRNLILPNGVGIVDADYYNNEANEGEIFFQLINWGPKTFKIKKGDRIGQGIFMSYLTTDDDVESSNTRTGGFGSSGLH